MNNITLFSTSILTALIAVSASAQSVVNANGAKSSYINSEWDGANPTQTTVTNSDINFIGAMNSTAPGSARQAFIAFDLPTLTGAPTSAIVSFNMRSSDAVSSAPWFNIDAYGFTTTPTTSDLFIGSSDASKTLLANDVITPSTANSETININLTSYLSTLYTAGNPNIATVYIRLNPDDPDGNLGTGGDGFGRYRADLFNSGGDSQVTLTIVPEPSTYAALLGATALALVAIRRRK